MANINLYKSRIWAFVAISHRFPGIIHYMISINYVTLKYGSRSRCTTIAMAPFDGKYLISYLMAIVMFALSLNDTERLFCSIVVSDNGSTVLRAVPDNVQVDHVAFPYQTVQKSAKRLKLPIHVDIMVAHLFSCTQVRLVHSSYQSDEYLMTEKLLLLHLSINLD